MLRALHDRAAQLDAADLAGRHVLARDRVLADQRVDVRRLRDRASSSACSGLRKNEQRHDREDREEEELDPERAGDARAGCRTLIDDGRDPEEDDVEPARRGELERDQNEAERQPVPPGDDQVVRSLLPQIAAAFLSQRLAYHAT